MTLIPNGPAGRLNRKALAFASEIGQLYLRGYSCEAIRRALADAGLSVSRSTVTREVARHVKRRQAGQTTSETVALVAERPSLSPPKPVASSALASDPRSGREIAAAWVKDFPANPLIRVRIAHESSRH